ncbi:MAG: sulfatase-like hydrolase/transferase, partial [Opitutae bacterium]|nr:sulfatase-like hydrolase/transferase [Opitutae bacterium]
PEVEQISEYNGHIEGSRGEATPWWPEAERPRAGAPNVVIIYMDDLGYSDPGCYGSEIDTPHIDALAARGQQFTHYTTHPICSPARAALLTGRNAHSVGTGWLSNTNAGFPGYTGEIPLDVPTLAETFRAAGYETLMTGKWHNTPTLDTVPSGPKHNWPTQRGFDTFYGFLEGETHFFFPSRLQQNNQLVAIDAYPQDYYATDDWTDRSIQFIKELRGSSADKPFFLYLAHNAVHAPLQSKSADLAKYSGRYDEGWTELRAQRFHRQLEMGLVPEGTRLPESDPRVPLWQETDPADRKLFARHMETYAAMLDCVDQNLGKLVACLEQLGELDNTIIVFTSDNGGTDAGETTGMFNNNRRYMGLPPASIESDRARVDELGGPRSVSLYPTGWGEVCNTPFPSFKTYTGAGGRRVSFLVSWPSGLKDQGVIRRQFVHVTDIMPTLLELTGVEALTEVNGKAAQGMHGLSFANVLRSNEPSRRTEQYYECWANRAFYREGWLARSIQKRGEPIVMDNWTLHNLEEDFSEATDVSDQHQDKLAELVDAFDKAAWENRVYPLDNRDRIQKFSDLSEEQKAAADRPRTFLPGTQTIHRADFLPLVADRSFSMSVRFTSESEDEGVLWALGDPIGGMVLYLEDGEIGLHYNGFGEETSLPAVALPAGSHEVTLDYEELGNRQGRGRLLVDAVEAVGWMALSPTLAFGIFEGLDVGLDRRGPVWWALYERHGAFPFTGEIQDLQVVPGKRARV